MMERMSRKRSLAFRDRHVEAVEGRRDEAVKANEVNQLIGTMLSKRFAGEAIERLRQRSAADKR
jgi:hypothetical protein